MPSRTFSVPSTTTRSPIFSPSVIIHGSDSRAHLHTSDADLVTRPNDRYLVTTLKLGHGSLRDKQCALLQLRNRSDTRRLARPENAGRVRERAHHLQGTRLRIKLTVGKEDSSLISVSCTIGQNQLERNGTCAREEIYGAWSESLGNPEVFDTTNRKVGFNRIDLGDRRQHC